MTNVVKDAHLKKYVQNNYAKYADRRGGSMYIPLNREDLVRYYDKVQHALNNSFTVILCVHNEYPSHSN